MSQKNTLEAKRARKAIKQKERNYQDYYTVNAKGKLEFVDKITYKPMFTPAALFYITVLSRLGLTL